MNIDDINIRPARAEEFAAIVTMLRECDLLADDLSPGSLSTFHVAVGGNRLLGVCGFEGSAADGLLRSLAVAADQRKCRLGERLVAACEGAARAIGIERLYLLTTSADAYLRRLGYADVARTRVPPEIAGHPQFRGLCPASARCLAKTL